jgi:mono/diheme cytochrome c family protein
MGQRRIIGLTCGGLAGLALLAACAPEGGPILTGAQSAAAVMPDAGEGAALYAENCAVCHGPAGRGDGLGARGMRPAPTDLTLIAARNDGTLPRADVLSTLDGYTRVQGGDVAMPEFGALLEGDTVPVELEDGSLSPVPRPLAALLVYIESIQAE